MTTQEIYSLACTLRIQADATGDPELYRKAAAEFRSIDFLAAAESCDQHAAYYEAAQ